MSSHEPSGVPSLGLVGSIVAAVTAIAPGILWIRGVLKDRSAEKVNHAVATLDGSIKLIKVLQEEVDRKDLEAIRQDQRIEELERELRDMRRSSRR